MRHSLWILPGALCLMAMGVTDSCSDDPSPGTQGTIEIAAGNGQTAPASTALPTAIAARVVGTSGKAIAGVPVHWIVASGGGSVPNTYTSTTAVTALNDAVATVQWTLGPAAGPQTLLATVDDLDPADTLVFTATATGGGGAHPLAEISVYNGTSSGGMTATVATPYQGNVSYGPMGASQMDSDSLQVEVGVVFTITATLGAASVTQSCTTTAGIVPVPGNASTGSALAGVFQDGGLIITCNGNWQ